MTTPLPDALTQAAVLLETPDALRQWLSDQDPNAVYDAHAICGCFLHGFLSSHVSGKISCCPVQVRINGKTLKSRPWNRDFQSALSEAQYQTPQLTCAAALRILDSIIADTREGGVAL